MEFITAVGRPEAIKTDAIVVGVHADGELTPTAKLLDAASKGAIKAAVKSGDMTGKRGALLPLLGISGVAARRVLLTGLGAKDDFNERHFTDAVRGSVKAFNGAVKNVTVAALDWHVRKRDTEWQAYSLAVAARETAFRTDELKSKREADTNGAATVGLLLKASNAGAERGLRYGGAIANGMELTKRLGNLPPNICTPSFLADEARKMAKKWNLGIEVLEAKQLEALKMGSFLSVAKGSAQPPRLIVMKYKGAAKGAPDRAGWQGHHVRFRRHFAQARRRDGRNEVRHVRRRQRDRDDARAGRAEAEDQRRRRRCCMREHAIRWRGQAG